MFLDHNKGSANFNSDGRVLSLLEESQQQGERRKYLESYRAHRGLDAVDIRLAPGIPWESLDYYSRMAAKHSVGAGLLPGSDYSTVYVAAHWKESKGPFLLLIGWANDGGFLLRSQVCPVVRLRG